MTNHMDRLETALSLLDEARGFAAMSPQGRDNIVEVWEMLPDLIEKTYRSGFVDGEQHTSEQAEIEHKRNSSFVPVQKTGINVHRLTQFLYRVLRDHPEIDIAEHVAQTSYAAAIYSLPEMEEKARQICAQLIISTAKTADVTDAEIEAASRAIYEHKPYLNHSGKSHMAWSVFKRELPDEYERLKVAVRIGLDAARATQSDYETHIRSALVDVPAVESEPVAWQPKYKQDVIDHHRSIGSDLWEYAMTVYPTKAQAEGYGYGGHEARPLFAHPPRSSLIQSDEGETVYRWRGPRGGWIYDDKPPKWDHETLVVRPALSRKTAAPGDGSAIAAKDADHG
jgi:hypothetical protein